MSHATDSARATLDEVVAAAAHHATDAMLVIDGAGRVVWANAAFEQVTGFRPDESLGAVPLDLLAGPETDRLASARLAGLLRTGSRGRVEVQHHRRDGTPFWHEVSIAPLGGSAAAASHRLWSGRDVSERRTLARRFVELSSVMELSIDGILVLDDTQRVRMANGAFARMHGHATGAELQGRSWREFYSPEQLDVFDRSILQELVMQEHWHGEVTGRRADGTTYPQELTVSLISGGMAMVVRDITERSAHEEALHRLSLTDSLTGLYNRRGFTLLAQQLLTVAARQPHPAVLLYLDLDRFKAINDEFGHHVGDQALVDVADLLRETFREADLIGRLGGDEFVVLAVNTQDATGEVLLSRLDRQLAQRNAAAGRPYALSIGRGVAWHSAEHPRTLAQLLEEADGRLLAGKRGRGRR
ncbi:MAG: diguanylate cyclase [Gemmatimonadaceae bacterium]|nr:diguanylate cyclase [Gemmatimonadaceae bacterium]